MPGPAPIPTLSMVHSALWRPRAPFGTQSPPPGCPRVAHLVHGPCLHRGWWRADTSSPPYKEKSLIRIFKSGRRKHTICLSHHTPLNFYIFMKVPSNRFKSFHVTSCNFKASRASCHGKFPGERQTRNTNPIHPGPIRTDLVE